MAVPVVIGGMVLAGCAGGPQGPVGCPNHRAQDLMDGINAFLGPFLADLFHEAASPGRPDVIFLGRDRGSS